MKQFLFGCVLFFLGGISIAYAIDAPTDLRALEASDTSIHLDWSDVPSSLWYYMYHGAQSGSGSSYEIEGIDVINTSDYVLEWLSPQTKYYIAIRAIDDFWIESEYSQEFEYTTLDPGAESEATSFRIKDVMVLNKSTLEFVFSTDLDVSLEATMEFIVEEKISGKEIYVDLSQVNEDDVKNVIVLLSDELTPALEYKVTVLDIRDMDGNTIESGIDAFISFMMPAVIEEDTVEEDTVEEDTVEDVIPVEEDTTPVEEDSQEVDVDLESAGSENTQEQSEVSWWNAGTTLSQDELSGSVTQTAGDNEALPQTWAEHWLLLILAIFISGGIYLRSSKKHSSTSVK